jgi:16S rRNA (guanine527-N7)-methyltransferase
VEHSIGEKINEQNFIELVNLNGVEIGLAQIALMKKYVDLLAQKNTSINLVSRKDIDYIWERHILHSISPLKYFSFLPQSKILDLGTGGGLPGIPLKILCPQTKMTLLDSINKKIAAVEEFIKKLDLENTSTYCGRVEDLEKVFSKKFDFIICRAVTNLRDLINWSFPLLNTYRHNSDKKNISTKQTLEHGTLIVYKGGNIDEEIKDAELHCNYKSLKIIDLKFTGIDATILSDKKIILVNF